MSKAIIMALALSVATAQAGTVFKVPNKAGGFIGFTDNQCTDDKDKNFAYTQSATGEILIAGCYQYDTDDKVFIVLWSDKTAFSYPLDAAELTDYGSGKYQEQQTATTDQQL